MNELDGRKLQLPEELHEVLREARRVSWPRSIAELLDTVI
jgi:hypothetical protein